MVGDKSGKCDGELFRSKVVYVFLVSGNCKTSNNNQGDTPPGEQWVLRKKTEEKTGEIAVEETKDGESKLL